MSIADEIHRLQQLHRSGALTDEEFAAAKAKVLAEGTTQPQAGPNPAMQEQLDELRMQNAVTRLDREWEMERENYMVSGRYGYRYIPNKTTSLIGGVGVTVFGIFWTLLASGLIFSAAPLDVLPFLACFPLFGVLFVALGIATTLHAYNKGSRYEQAERRYQRRRGQLLEGLPSDEDSYRDQSREWDNYR
jgi:hypothetical protein